MSRFDDFWSLYPKRVNKKTAKDLWVRKGLDDHAAEIVAHLERRVRLDAQWKKGYICGPEVFLRREKWNDEYQEISLTQRPAERQEQDEDIPPQGCRFESYLNRRLMKLLRRANGVSPDKLDELVRYKNHVASQCRDIWGDRYIEKDEFEDLMLGACREMYRKANVSLPRGLRDETAVH